MLKARHANLKCWAEDFQHLLSMDGDISTDALERVKQLPTASWLAQPPELSEIKKPIDSLQNRKVPGKDGISGDRLKFGGRSLHTSLHNVTVSS